MTRKKLYLLFAGLTLAGYAWLAWNIAEESGRAGPPDACLFKTVTHLPCPSCGTTRALADLFRGDVRDSLLTNPFGVFIALALIIVPFWTLADTLRGKDSFFRWYTAGERILMQSTWLKISAVAVVLINWAWNISKGL